MNHLHLNAADLSAVPLKKMTARTLLMMPSSVAGAVGPHWGLRFDRTTEDDAAAMVLWLNGMPWNGADQAFHAMDITNHQVGDMPGIACGLVAITVDMASGVGGGRSDVSWGRARGYIAVTAAGTYLVGRTPSHQHAFSGYYAIDLATFENDRDAHREPVVEWFSRWQLTVGDAEKPFTLAFDARAVAAKAA